jgi:hypothetical protein
MKDELNREHKIYIKMGKTNAHEVLVRKLLEHSCMGD